jgi:hypothetical protein
MIDYSNENIIYLTWSTYSLYYCTNLCYEGAKNIETYPYVVNKKYDAFETVAMEAFYLLRQALHKGIQRGIK